MVVGNKSDLKPEQRQVSLDEGRQLGEEFHCAYTEASARLGYNVEKTFDLMIGEIEKSQNPSQPTGGNKCAVMWYREMAGSLEIIVLETGTSNGFHHSYDAAMLVELLLLLRAGRPNLTIVAWCIIITDVLVEHWAFFHLFWIVSLTLLLWLFPYHVLFSDAGILGV